MKLFLTCDLEKDLFDLRREGSDLTLVQALIPPGYKNYFQPPVVWVAETQGDALIIAVGVAANRQQVDGFRPPV